MDTSTGKSPVVGVLCGLIGYLIVSPPTIEASILAQGRLGSPGIERAAQLQGFASTDVSTLSEIPPELRGAGVSFAVICRSLTYADGIPQSDYLPDIGHQCFLTGQWAFHDLGTVPPGISGHATAVCSVLFGDDSQAFHPQFGLFHYRGLVPQATANIHEFWKFMSDHVFPLSFPETDIITLSLGSYFEDWWTRGLEAVAEQYGTIIVASIGNGSDASDTVLYPGAASNVIGVGVAESLPAGSWAHQPGDDYVVWAEQSSAGPTLDGRCKPDLVAPGRHLVATASSANDYEVEGNWSSLAAPFTAGVVGLLLEQARCDPSLSLAVCPAGGNCVMKAILLNSAVKLPGWHKGGPTGEDDHQVPLDYLQGAGMLNGARAHALLVAGRGQPGEVAALGWDNNLLDTTHTPGNTYRLWVPEARNRTVSVTLTWNRRYDDVYPFDRNGDEDTDLRLELWAVSPDEAQLIDYSDSSVDNVEHIHCAGVAGFAEYEITVSCKDSDLRQETQYALAWSASASGSDRDSGSL